MINRREFIKVSIAASLFSGLGACRSSVRWEQAAYRKQATSRVAILEAKSYQTSLKDIINRGVHLLKLDVKGKRIVLKPNLVEFDPASVINTHPAVIEAAIDSFRSLGAREVVVAEGPGHRRDSEYLLTASGIYDVIKEHRVRYVDLNTDDVRLTELRSDFTNLRQLYFPETLFNADLLVSMPKLKTHHWAGVTLSLKNMFGVVPGSVYGWPKNALHWAGIHGSILDIFPLGSRVVETLGEFTETVAQLNRVLLSSGNCRLRNNGSCRLFRRTRNLFGNWLCFFFRRDWFSFSLRQRNGFLSRRYDGSGHGLDTWRCCGHG